MNKFIDITNKHFGFWTALSYKGNGFWLCRCQCGTERAVSGGDLRNGGSKSCGCRHRPNLIGQKYGRLTVLKEVEPDFYVSGNKRAFLCRCECGNEIRVAGDRLLSGNTKSCGCLHKQQLSQSSTKHGFRKNGNVTRLYHTWQNLKNRCENKNLPDYKFYGARGISVCNEWRNDFQAFYDWAMGNGYAENLTIDRIDTNGNYEPSNCRWITIQAQQRNKRTTVYLTYNGETLPLIDMAEKYNIPYRILYQRIYHGWDIKRAITTSCEG